MILASNQITFQKQGLGVLTFLNNLKALKNFWKLTDWDHVFWSKQLSETVSGTKSK